MSPIGSSWTSFEQEIFDESEIAETQFRIRLILEIIETPQQLGISQRKLEKLSGVKQSMIARVEKGSVNPSLATVLKLLVPLGKTLQIVPLDKNKTVR
ncbi:helix-turn-helix domain-containing protein [Actinobacillus pleuropneumoniae]|uniref:helix-turn-helix domain-containing protein n=1 Tax=Actinobacillus pleuropneumoniae TaxID=715 RepID=UPI003B02D5B0